MRKAGSRKRQHAISLRYLLTLLVTPTICAHERAREARPIFKALFSASLSTTSSGPAAFISSVTREKASTYARALATNS